MPEVPAVPRAPSLAERVAHAFAEGGPLARAVSDFEPRPSQLEMAEATAEVLEAGGVLLAEAGTGIGKTLAYLVPAILSASESWYRPVRRTSRSKSFSRISRLCARRFLCRSRPRT